MSRHRLFNWTALNKTGELQTGMLLATERNSVYEHIIQHGLQPLGVKGEGGYLHATGKGNGWWQ